MWWVGFQNSLCEEDIWLDWQHRRILLCIDFEVSSPAILDVVAVRLVFPPLGALARFSWRAA